jgi:hypothetical protein
MLRRRYKAGSLEIKVRSSKKSGGEFRRMKNAFMERRLRGGTGRLEAGAP